MNERIKELVKKSGGEVWQRIESNGVLNKEAYIIFDPPESLEKLVKLVVLECMDVVRDINQEYDGGSTVVNAADEIKEHFGVE